MKNYKEYIDYCQRLAEDVNDSWDLVNMMREYDHEKFNDAVDEVQGSGFEFEGDINAHMTWIAFFLIRNGIHSAYQHIESEVVA